VVYGVFNGNGTARKNTNCERFEYLGIHYVHFGDDAFISRNRVKMLFSFIVRLDSALADNSSNRGNQ
jgi:hypothetical protein